MDVRERLADGRYGPVFLAHDRHTDALVVVRTFEAELDPAQRALLVDGLQRACEAPLQHASIGRPLACGIDDDRAYVLHGYLPGQPADAWLREHGPASLGDLLVAIASVAAAIDFAAAVGVHHGALTPADIVLDGDTAGVTGWGIEQARATAGLTQATPSHAGDIAAFASSVYALIAQDDAAQVQRVFERAWSRDPSEQFQAALEFAATLQQVAPVMQPAISTTPTETTDRVTSQERFTDIEEPADAAAVADIAAIDEPFDVPLRDTDEYASQAPPSFDGVQGASSRIREAADGRSTPSRRSLRWTPVLAVAVLTLVVGFAAGWLVAHQTNDATVTVAPAPAATATTGQALADVPVVEPQVVPSDAEVKPPAQAPVAPPASGPDVGQEAPRPPDGEAVLQVDSRPRGAQVYVDGRLIGRTPAAAGGLRPGRHTIRMRLSGHRDWTTDVTVSAGEHARIGGSLEELY